MTHQHPSQRSCSYGSTSRFTKQFSVKLSTVSGSEQEKAEANEPGFSSEPSSIDTQEAHYTYGDDDVSSLCDVFRDLSLRETGKSDIQDASHRHTTAFKPIHLLVPTVFEKSYSSELASLWDNLYYEREISQLDLTCDESNNLDNQSTYSKITISPASEVMIFDLASKCESSTKSTFSKPTPRSILSKKTNPNAQQELKEAIKRDSWTVENTIDRCDLLDEMLEDEELEEQRCRTRAKAIKKYKKMVRSETTANTMFKFGLPDFGSAWADFDWSIKQAVHIWTLYKCKPCRHRLYIETQVTG